MSKIIILFPVGYRPLQKKKKSWGLFLKILSKFLWLYQKIQKTHLFRRQYVIDLSFTVRTKIFWSSKGTIMMYTQKADILEANIYDKVICKVKLYLFFPQSSNFQIIQKNNTKKKQRRGRIFFFPNHQIFKLLKKENTKNKTKESDRSYSCSDRPPPS